MRMAGVETRLHKDKILSNAKRKAHATGFADDAFDEPLSVLIKSLNEEADLSPFGKVMARQILTAALVNRLEIETKIGQEPDLLHVAVQKPVFVIGYPRTGTTLLHNLLSLDRANRSLRMFEALRPASQAPPNAQDDDRRIGQAEKFIKATHYLSPQFSVIHPLSAEGPDECLKLIENTFVSPHFLLYFDVPQYWEWLLRQDTARFSDVYLYHRRQLQILGISNPQIRWALKAPIHVFCLDALLKVYPDARIVFLHRDPRVAVPSFCSLLAVSRSMTSENVDTDKLGDFALATYELFYERALSARATAPPTARIYDLQYHTLKENPAGAITDIYEKFNLPVEEDFEQAIASWVNRNPQHKHGIHRYSMGNFGLTPDRFDYASTLALS